MLLKLFHASRRASALGTLLCTLAAVGCGSPTEGEAVLDSDNLGESQAPVVYGTDNRTDVYAHTNATLRARAQQSTVALMQSAMLNTSNPNNVTFNAYSLGTAQNLCTTERFRDDPAAAFCSGTLIDNDLVLTAGHCFNTISCADTRFVFNFYRTSATALQPVTTQDIFSCQSIVVRQYSFDVNGKYQDYAIVRLDRAATPRFTPAPIRPWSSALPQNQSVSVIGSSSGIPFKIDSGGTVRYGNPSTLDTFVDTTDTFPGNSGAGVYESTGFTLAGIHTRGNAENYISNGTCNVVKVCSETGCTGQFATYVRPALSAYCQVASSTRLCNTSYSTSVFSGPLSRYSLSRTSTTLFVTDTGGADGTRTFTNIVRLRFTDRVIAFDLDGNAGKVYRLYQAAFNRTPDSGGLGFWINAMDNGTSLRTVASNFMSSAEFAALYGSNPSNQTFVTNLYFNVLHRQPDQGGFDFWVNALNSGTAREDVLISFSEGFENRAGVLPAMAEGIVYTPYP
jgi:V8-like Glu-specific endopeptidase